MITLTLFALSGLHCLHSDYLAQQFSTWGMPNPGGTQAVCRWYSKFLTLLKISAVPVFNLLYKDESVCAHMYVCPAACRRTYTSYHPKNLAWAPHFTWPRHQARGRPKMLAPEGTPHSDPVSNSPKGKQLGGGQQTKNTTRSGFAQ